MFSKSCEYGLRASIYIAEQSIYNNTVGLKAIAKAINSPESFTAKILQILTKTDIITSVKGPHGGFSISESKMKKVFISDIVKVLDGDGVYTNCALGLVQCNENSPCPLHHNYAPIRDGLRRLLEETSLYDTLFTDNKKNSFWLKI